MAKYKVRQGFCVRLGDLTYPQGSEIDLSNEQLNLVAHQVEVVQGKKKESE